MGTSGGSLSLAPLIPVVMHFKRNIKKSLGISLFPSAMITFMLDYGSAEKTFTTKTSGRESVITGLDGIGIYVKEHGFLGYVVSVLPTSIGILAILIALTMAETYHNEKRKSRHIKQ